MNVQKLKTFLVKKLPSPILLTTILLLTVGLFAATSPNQKVSLCQPDSSDCQSTSLRLSSGCGSGKNEYVQTSIDFGCDGDNCPINTLAASPPYCSSPHNGITDLLFAIIRFLSDGVGIVVVLSVVIGGIQYITSRGDPRATQSAIQRLTSALIALLVFVFAYAILNYVVPNGFFKQ